MTKYDIAAEVAKRFNNDAVLAVRQAERNEIEGRGHKFDPNIAIGLAQLILACVQTALMLKSKEPMDAAALAAALRQHFKTEGAVDPNQAMAVANAVKAEMEERHQ